MAGMFSLTFSSMRDICLTACYSLDARPILKYRSGNFYSKSDLCLKTHSKFIRNVSRHFRMNHSKASWDTSNEFRMCLETLSNDFPKCLKTLWYLFEVSQDALVIIRKRLKTLSNDSFKSVLRRFEWILNASWDIGHFSNKSSQTYILI